MLITVRNRKDDYFMRTKELSVPVRQRRGKRKRRRARRRFLRTAALLCGVCVLAGAALHGGRLPDAAANVLQIGGGAKLKAYAGEHGLSLSDYPKELIDLYERNPETEQFVFEYPLVKDHPPAADLSGTDTSTVPLLMQWDQRWGYQQYAGDVFGLTGCGPTCLSMVAMYLTGDTSMTPGWMGQFAEDSGYASDGNGSAWALISEGGQQLGLDVTEIPLDEQRVIDNLEVGNPIVVIMGPGDFTTSGHFIVFTGYEDGKIKVNDPNSRKNSEKLWEFSDIQDQIRNLWAFRS